MHSAMSIILPFHLNGLPRAVVSFIWKKLSETVISFQAELIISLESFTLRFEAKDSRASPTNFITHEVSENERF